MPQLKLKFIIPLIALFAVIVGVVFLSKSMIQAKPTPQFVNMPTEVIIYDKRVVLNPPPGFNKLRGAIEQKQVAPE